MKEIYNELPGLEETARRVTRSTDENAMRKGDLFKFNCFIWIMLLTSLIFSAFCYMALNHCKPL